MKKSTVLKLIIAIILIRVDIPVFVDILPDFVGYLLLMMCATEIMRESKNAWWIRCLMLATAAITAVIWIWKPTYWFVTLPVGILCAFGLYAALSASCEVIDTVLQGRISGMRGMILAGFVLDIISVTAYSLGGFVYAIPIMMINLIIAVLLTVRLYSAYKMMN